MMLQYRQIHLDFHTSEHIKGIGCRFSPENFEQALREGHVDSITLFAKCHHGWSYHNTKVNQRHPGLEFDLLSAQLDVCKKMGIRTQIYVSAGFDEKYAVNNPQHIIHNKTGIYYPLDKPGFHRLCLGSEYLKVLADQVEEVLELFKDKFDGLFLDIIAATPCYCDECRARMEELGIDTEDDAAVMEYAKRVYREYCDVIDAVVTKITPGLPIIHNDGGAIFQGRHVAYRNKGHFEIESLPTGGWGYDHFPKAAAYARTLGREFVGMTGKFHSTWGEFGGYKHPNALLYETSLSNACGARCSIGDQLHPDGEMDSATYRLIGKAYAEVEKREPWLINAENIADIGLVSAEACANSPYSADFDCYDMLKNGTYQDLGANRIMLEGHYLYNIIDPEEDFTKYKLLILPDNILLNGRFAEKIKMYVNHGGKLLFTGKSGTDFSGRFAVDFGIVYLGEKEKCPSYMRPRFDLYPNGITSYVMYSKGYSFDIKKEFKGEIRADWIDTFFNRTAEHFCSHAHTPYDRNLTGPAIVVTDNIGYVGWEIFSEYAQKGSVHLKYAVCDVIDKLLGDDRTITTSLPSQGIVAMFMQNTANNKRLVNHVLYAIPKVRGKGVEIIEDIPTTLNTTISVKTDKKPLNVYLAPEMKALEFTYAGGRVTYTIPEFTCSTLVIIDF